MVKGKSFKEEKNKYGLVFLKKVNVFCFLKWQKLKSVVAEKGSRYDKTELDVITCGHK